MKSVELCRLTQRMNLVLYLFSQRLRGKFSPVQRAIKRPMDFLILLKPPDRMIQQTELRIATKKAFVICLPLCTTGPRKRDRKRERGGGRGSPAFSYSDPFVFGVVL